MDHHLVVHVFIGFSRLDHAIEGHDTPESCIFKDDEMLMVRLNLKKSAVVGKILTPVGVERFLESH